MLPNSLKIWRLNKGMTQRQLAAASGVHFNTISRWELGKITPKKEDLIPVAKALSVSVEDLMTEPTQSTSEAHESSDTSAFPHILQDVDGESPTSFHGHRSGLSLLERCQAIVSAATIEDISLLELRSSRETLQIAINRMNDRESAMSEKSLHDEKTISERESVQSGRLVA